MDFATIAGGPAAEKHLELLYDAGRRLGSTLDLDEILRIVCDSISLVAPNEGFYISAFDPEAALITCTACWMDDKWLDVSCFPPIPLEDEGRGTQSLVIRTGQALLLNDYAAQQRTAQTSYYVDSDSNEVVEGLPPDEEDVVRSAMIVPLAIGGVVRGVLQVMSYQRDAFSEDQLHLLEALALHIASAQQNALLYAQLQADLERRREVEAELTRSAAQLRGQLHDTVRTMGAIVGMRDPYTEAHERRVTSLALAVAGELQLDADSLEAIELAGSVHDIGKVAIPSEILSRPSRLSDVEFALIREHADAGRRLLSAIRFRQPVAEIVAQHHERLDGSGYPDGLRDGEILMEARVIAVADVVEAMSSHRPYRPAIGLGPALQEIRRGAGTVYDADVVAACERVFAQGFRFTDD
jgi:putative nucleotidyltransferase with HDIG domain